MQDLSERAEVGTTTIQNFETGKSAPRRATVKALQSALEHGGVEFTNGGQPGLRLTKPRE